MSRIGRMPIPLEASVKVGVENGSVSVEGPKGSLTQRIPRGITVEVADQQVLVHRENDSKTQASLHGMLRSLIANAVHGVSKGFERELEIHGVGYSAEVKGKQVHFKLGYSHPVTFPIPEGIEIKADRNKLTVRGHDRQRVGQVSADIRALRPPDVYKQKGIRYVGEQLRKKAGKAGAK